MEDRLLKFVARFYEAGRLDAGRAYSRFCKAAGIPEPETSAGRRWTMSSKIALTLSMAAAIAVFAIIGLSQGGWNDYRAIDIAQNFTLPDSTEVVLAPGTELKFRMKRNARVARMSGGKVYFNVHRDESSPFSINAGNGYVRVLGTQFQVSRNDASVRVDVSSGKVLFAAGHPDQADPSPVILTAGMSAILDAESPVPQIVEQGFGNFATWATQEFIFDNTPLEDVVAELSVYYGKDIIVNSPGDWKTKCLTASFAADDIREILPIISSALDVDMEIKP
ncbi:MAG: FecR family protein [Candidatus Cryptobacteroides sp.]